MGLGWDWDWMEIYVCTDSKLHNIMPYYSRQVLFKLVRLKVQQDVDSARCLRSDKTTITSRDFKLSTSFEAELLLV